MATRSKLTAHINFNKTEQPSHGTSSLEALSVLFQKPRILYSPSWSETISFRNAFLSLASSDPFFLHLLTIHMHLYSFLIHSIRIKNIQNQPFTSLTVYKLLSVFVISVKMCLWKIIKAKEQKSLGIFIGCTSGIVPGVAGKTHLELPISQQFSSTEDVQFYWNSCTFLDIN